MAKVLFLNHFEEMWDDEIKKYGTSLEESLEKVLDFLESTDIDKVIITNFDDDNINEDEYQRAVLNYCQKNGILVETQR